MNNAQSAYLLLVKDLDAVSPGLMVKIAGVAQGLRIDPTTIRKQDILTSDTDTLSFTVLVDSKDDKPKAGQEVIIEDGGERIFGGTIVRVDEKDDVDQLVYEVECSDYQFQFDQITVKDTYEDTSAGAGIRDFVSKNCPGFTTNNVADGPTIKKISFPYRLPTECMRQYSELTGYDWYIDYFKDVHFFPKEENTAPFTLDDTDEGKHYWDLVLNVDISQLRNRVFVRGGTYLSDDKTYSWKVDGQQREWKLPRILASMTLTVGGASKAYGFEYDDEETAFEYFYNPDLGILRCAESTTTPATDTVISVTGKYDVPIRIVREDSASVQRMKDLGFGDGVFEYVITDREIKTKEEARLRAGVELEKHAGSLVEGGFKTRRKGLRSGMLIQVKSNRRGYNDWYLIRQVTTRYVTTEQNSCISVLEYDVTIATHTKGIREYLQQIKAALAPSVEIADNEILDEVVSPRDETEFSDSLAVTESAPTYFVIGQARIGYCEIP